MLTRPEIIAAVEKFKAAYTEWLHMEEFSPDERAQNLFSQYHGRYVRRITPWLCEAAMELFSLLDTDQIERDAWPLVLHLDRFDAALTVCAERMLIAGADQDPNGGVEVWRPWEDALAEIAKPRVFRNPEPIPQLREMRNPPSSEQICKMYHWYDRYGNPDVARLQREIDNPGSEFNPETWVNPWEQAYWKGVTEQWQQRCRRLTTQQTEQEAKQAKKPVAETVEDLVLSGVNAAQIKKMHPEVTDEEIEELCAEFGVTLDGGVHASFMGAVRERERRQLEGQLQAQKQLSSRLSTIETYAELGDDVEARIIRMHEDGHKAGHISQALKNQLKHPIASGMVGKIIAAHRRAAAAQG